MLEREQLQRVLQEVLEGYQLLTSFDFSQDEILKCIKDSLQGRASISRLFLRKVLRPQGSNCDERLLFTNSLDQLKEGLRGLFFIQPSNFDRIAKDICDFKLSLEERVIRRIDQRITELEKCLSSPTMSLVQAAGLYESAFPSESLHQLSLQDLESRYGQYNLSRAQREVFQRLSDYFRKARHL